VKIVVYEPPASYTPSERNGMIMVRCDCSCADVCPQGRRGSDTACFVWMSTAKFRRKELAKLRSTIAR